MQTGQEDPVQGGYEHSRVEDRHNGPGPAVQVRSEHEVENQANGQHRAERDEPLTPGAATEGAVHSARNPVRHEGRDGMAVLTWPELHDQRVPG